MISVRVPVETLYAPTNARTSLLDYAAVEISNHAISPIFDRFSTRSAARGLHKTRESTKRSGKVNERERKGAAFQTRVRTAISGSTKYQLRHTKCKLAKQHGIGTDAHEVASRVQGLRNHRRRSIIRRIDDACPDGGSIFRNERDFQLSCW